MVLVLSKRKPLPLHCQWPRMPLDQEFNAYLFFLFVQTCHSKFFSVSEHDRRIKKTGLLLKQVSVNENYENKTKLVPGPFFFKIASRGPSNIFLLFLIIRTLMNDWNECPSSGNYISIHHSSSCQPELALMIELFIISFPL